MVTRPSFKVRIFLLLSILCIVAAVLAYKFYQPLTNPVAYSLEQKIAKIEAKQPSEEKEVHALRAAFLNGDIDTLENALQTARTEKRIANTGRSYETLVFARIFADFYPEDKYLEYVNHWIESYPQSPFGYMARADFLSQKAWSIRGAKFAYLTPGNRMEKFYVLQQDAFNDLQQAWQLGPDVSYPYERMAQIAGIIGGSGTQVQENIIEEAKKSGIHDLVGVYFQTLIHGYQPRWGGNREAMFAFARQAIDDHPNLPLMHMLLAEAHYDTGRTIARENRLAYYQREDVWNDISLAYETMTKATPKSAVWFSEYALWAYKAGKYQLSGQMLNRAFFTDPYYYRNYEEAAKMYIKGERYDLAERHLTEYLALVDDNYSPYRHMANIRRKQKDYQGVIDYTSKAIDLYPNHCTLWAWRCLGKTQLGKYDDALADCNEAIKRFPACKMAFYNRGNLYEAMGEAKKSAMDKAVYQRLSR